MATTYGTVPHQTLPQQQPPPYPPPPYQPTSPTYYPTQPVCPHHYQQHPTNVHPTQGGRSNSTEGPWIIYAGTPAATAPPLTPPQSIPHQHVRSHRRRLKSASGGFVSAVLVIIVLVAGYFIFKNLVREPHH